MKPTHVHRQHGGPAARIGTAQGEAHHAGQTLVIFLDMGMDPPNTDYLEISLWESEWQEIPSNACPVCHGSGHDQIKKRKDRPCGGCYGLGRVKEDGETPKGEWEVAEVAGRIIAELKTGRAEAERRLAQVREIPGVVQAIGAEQARRLRGASDAQAEQERKWREGRGHGPGGARYTGD